MIRRDGLPKQLAPAVFVFTGTGNVSKVGKRGREGGGGCGDQARGRYAALGGLRPELDQSAIPTLRDRAPRKCSSACRTSTWRQASCRSSVETVVNPHLDRVYAAEVSAPDWVTLREGHAGARDAEGIREDY
ncbi:MAG: hypothetical protein BJ554DRAFT_6988, partial [Olpidium bornovanus]